MDKGMYLSYIHGAINTSIVPKYADVYPNHHDRWVATSYTGTAVNEIAWYTSSSVRITIRWLASTNPPTTTDALEFKVGSTYPEEVDDAVAAVSLAALPYAGATPAPVSISLASDPAGAQVYVDGTYKGMT